MDIRIRGLDTKTIVKLYRIKKAHGFRSWREVIKFLLEIYEEKYQMKLDEVWK